MKGLAILCETWTDDEEHTLVPLYDNEDSVCGIVYNNTPYYFQKNLQGDVIGITDEDGTVVAEYVYDAWGKVIDISGCDACIAQINPFRYRGYYYDQCLQLYYLQSRYYDPEIGRFINADEVTSIPANLQILFQNYYSYVNNNPVYEKDIAGYSVGSLLFDIFAGVICGALIQLYSDLLNYILECLIKGRKKAEFRPCIGEYISSILSYVLDFTNPFKGTQMKVKFLTLLIPLAAKYVYKLFLTDSLLTFAIFWVI